MKYFYIVKCPKSSGELCIETIFNGFTAVIGPDGTNDDVFLEVCSDIDPSKCCKTPALKATFSDDWSTNDTEVWSDKYLGSACKNQKFQVDLVERKF